MVKDNVSYTRCRLQWADPIGLWRLRFGASVTTESRGRNQRILADSLLPEDYDGNETLLY